MRQVIVGRAKNMPEDIRDFSVSLLSGDMEGVSEVTGRRGENVTVDSTETVGVESTVTAGAAGSNDLINEVKRLGEATKDSSHPNGKYVWGATGPSSYDCSGIIWRAVKNLGIYTGTRFTTSTIDSVAGGWAQRVTLPAIGDIVVWPGKHMGIITGQDTYYSARTPAKGIGTATISGDSPTFGVQPVYWRVTS